ncbi:hypothetical protein JLK41_02995 [Ectopseudomonas khazarica]|uniref:type II secretion system protein GspM n=1 Tax=Ectopseudomonas khazarica TaxID=2502979 RepID=UPI00064769EF|nr:type II secretion system protein GspM [Pseudomonas khazarica]QTS87155.1 hypothetical protein JLK41_02995 [Pseudomonas khazarica]
MSPLLNRHHALVSWGLLVLLLLLLLGSYAGALADRHERYRFELLRDGRTLQQLQSVEASREQLQAANQEYQANNLGQWVFPSGQDAQSVSLSIQRSVSDALGASKASIRSIAPLSLPPRDGVLVVGVQAQFAAGLDEIQQVVRRLEAARPMLAIENLRMVAAVQRSVARGPAPQVLQVSMSVVSYLPAPTSGSAEGEL